MSVAGVAAPLGAAVARAQAALAPRLVAGLAPAALAGRLTGARVAWAPAGGDDEGGAALREGAGGMAALDGAFSCVPGAATAEWLLLGARTAGGEACAAWVCRGEPGLTVTPREAVGLHGAALAGVRLEGCAVPAERVVRDGLALQAALAEERRALSAAVLAAAERVFDDTLAWVGGRPFGAGRMLGEQQAVRHRLADLAAEIELARAYLAECAASPAEGDAAARSSAMLALVSADAARAVVEGCLQLRGARGFGEDDPASATYRDLLALALLPAFHPTALARGAAEDLALAAAAGGAP